MNDWNKATTYRRWQVRYGDKVIARLPKGPEYKQGVIVPTRAHLAHTPYGVLSPKEYLATCREALLGWRPPPCCLLVWFDGEEAPVVAGPHLHLRVIVNQGCRSHAV
jgi:hypothetical protein